MKQPLGERDKRALKFAGAAVGLFLLLQLLVLPVWDRAQEVSAQLPQKRQLLAKYRRLVEQSGTWTAESARLDEELQRAEAGLLQAPTDALAAAELEGLIKAAATAQQIDLGTSEFQKVDKGKGDYYEIPIMVQFQSRVDQLVNFLSAIQSSERLLRVQKLSVQPGGGKQKRVTATVTIGGWMRNGAGGKQL